jgi:hypothetical protein
MTEKESLTEKEVRSLIRIWAAENDVLLFPVPATMYSVVGVPDFVGLFHGRFLAIEAKSSKGIISSHQARFHSAIRAHGGLVFVVRSKQDLTDIGIVLGLLKDIS